MKLLTLILFTCLASINLNALAQSDSTKKVTIKLRGTDIINQPLVVIDGNKQYIRGSEALKEMDPENIESISILKGATSIAQYGIEGRNGVILLKTKSGRLSLNNTGNKKQIPFIFGTKTSVNSPLYIYDGNVVEKSFTDLLDTKNIESVNILKGHTAISTYGIEAINGVVIITSKKDTPKLKN